MAIVWLLIILLLAPVIMLIAGLVLLINTNPERKRKGKYILLFGVILFLLELLIGFSVCSNMNFH